MEKLKDKAAAAAQAILEPGIATDGGQQMSRQQFGIFIRRFAAASGVSFSAITDFLLVVPVFDYDPAFMDPGEPVDPPSLCLLRPLRPMTLYTYTCVGDILASWVQTAQLFCAWSWYAGHTVWVG